MNGAPSVAVAIHDLEPTTFGRCREIHSWLRDHGIDRVTLLVIPAPCGRAFIHDAEELAGWLRACVASGDAVAQHGLTHQRLRRPRGPRALLAHFQGGEAAEFPGRDPDATEASVRLGRRLLCEVGVEPHGFVAPAYAYTPALRRAATMSFSWWADLRGICIGGRRLNAPALGLGTSTPVKRALSPSLAAAAGALSSGTIMRIDIHPADFDLPRHVAALERLLRRAGGRMPVTYDELAC
jgi:predicted deacetylase